MALRTAIVGAGIVSENNHLPAVSRNPRTELVAVCDRDEESVDGHYYLFNEAAKALERGEQPPVPLAHSRWVLELMEQVREDAGAQETEATSRRS